MITCTLRAAATASPGSRTIPAENSPIVAINNVLCRFMTSLILCENRLYSQAAPRIPSGVPLHSTANSTGPARIDSCTPASSGDHSSVRSGGPWTGYHIVDQKSELTTYARIAAPRMAGSPRFGQHVARPTARTQPAAPLPHSGPCPARWLVAEIDGGDCRGGDRNRRPARSEG